VDAVHLLAASLYMCFILPTSLESIVCLFVCFYISNLNSDGSLKAENLNSLYYVVSGGNDHDLHIASFGLHVYQTEIKSINNSLNNERKDSQDESEPKKIKNKKWKT